jgi:hypothetical protein
MGILNFNKWIKETYPEAIKKTWLAKYDFVYIDLNYCLHLSSYNTVSEEEMFTKLYALLNSIIDITEPQKKIIICADNVAPLSKLYTQRKRRQTGLNTEINADEPGSAENFTTLNFTPGTTFMLTLGKKIEEYLAAVRDQLKISIVIDIDEPGEAEIKLKSRIADNIKLGDYTHIYVSNDADVVLLLVTLNEYKNIYICYNPYMYTSSVLSINKLLEKHVLNVGKSINYNLDFMAIMLFMGNDYLPKVNFLTFENLISSYKYILKLEPAGLILKNNDTIIKKDRIKYIKDLELFGKYTCDIEETVVANETELKINKTFLIKLMLCVSRTIKPGYNNKVTLGNICDNFYKNYFDGYTWCIDSYYNGMFKRYNYMCEYSMLPHPFSIAYNIMKTPNILDLKNIICVPVNPILYGMLILPKNKAQILIDKKYHKFMDETKELYGEILDIELLIKKFNFSVLNI